MMETTKLSSKGQVVLPKPIRDALDWPAGTTLTIETRDGSVTLRRADAFPRTTVEQVAGMFKTDRRVTLEDMERGIDEALRERWRRNR